MRTWLLTLLTLLVLALLGPGTAYAQAPSGTIAGVVRDSSGAGMLAVQVMVTSKDTDHARRAVTTASGDYSVAALPPGEYEVSALAPGFRRSLTQQVIVKAGTTTTVDMFMKLGNIEQSVIVSGAETPQMRYDSNVLGSVITREQIDGLPSNGRSVLDWSRLDPGVQQPTRQSNNRMLVPMLGAPAGQNGGRTRVTVDGGSVTQIGNGGSVLGFSQEVVQEFQLSTVNLDLSTGVTASGAVNIVTRSGTNQLHGSGFFFFRDHNLSAYPGLERDPLNPDPFFQRRQFGVVAGGPIHKGKAFFFGAWERNEQRDVVSTNLTGDFTPLSGIFPNPTYVTQFSGRADFKLTDKHLAFFRYSLEDIASFGPTGLTTAGSRALPSAWRRQPGATSQSILGLTSVVRTSLVNDLRASYLLVRSAELSPTEADCSGCLGIGWPQITVPDALFIGSSLTTNVLGQRYHLNDVATWQKSSHRIRFGGDLEVSKGGRTDLGSEPVAMTLFPPDRVREFNENLSTPASGRIPLPASFLTVDDILKLPVQSISVGIGDAQVPQKGLGLERVAPLVHLFVQDTWRLHPRVSVNYGLGWTYDSAFNYDLAKPAYLAQVLGEDNLGPTRRNWKNFSPSAGFAWSPRENGRMIVRGGAGIYHDFGVSFATADPERVSLGPRGVGRSVYPGTAIANPLTGIPGVPFGAPLNFSGNPTAFTGADVMRALPAIRTELTTWRDDPNNRGFTNIEADKTGPVVATNLPQISATHASLGVQRQIAAGLVVSADFVFRQFSHLGMAPDLNHFAKPGGRVLRTCTLAERRDPKALCSLGAIRVFSAMGRAEYHGLLVRVDKRFSRGWQFLGSYAYSTNVGTNAANGPNVLPGFDNDDPLASYGPLDRDVRHILNLSGLVHLPRQFQLGAFLTYNSTPPFTAFLGGLDLNGDGTSNDLLPGTKVNQFNRGLGKEDLRRLVDDFNGKYPGKKDKQNRDIGRITLPDDFEFGDALLTADLRLSWMLPFHGRWRLTLIGEVFNVFNTANLSGPSGDLLKPDAFGQAGLVTQVFGSGGPRSCQLAFRLSY